MFIYYYPLMWNMTTHPIRNNKITPADLFSFRVVTGLTNRSKERDYYLRYRLFDVW
jgi:hypothetical protein